jgi:hypothetical protein
MGMRVARFSTTAPDLLLDSDVAGKRDWARHEGKAQKAFPIGTRGHRQRRSEKKEFWYVARQCP